MPKRGLIAGSMLAGLVWAFGVVWIGRQVSIPIGLIQPVLIGAVFAPGLLMLAMVGRLAQRRFFDDAIIDGQPFVPGSGAEIDQRVLQNTGEQILLALCLWPLAGFVMGVGVPLMLGLAFVIARLAFWVGYHISPPLRGFGFAASFYPTVLAALWTLVELVT